MKEHINKVVAVWALALTAVFLMGFVVPNTFTPGTTISSSEVNANFEAIEAALTALEERPGRTVAIAHVDAAGNLTTSWMENGMTPTVQRAATGIYDIAFPGEPILNPSATNRCVIANAVNSSVNSDDAYATVSGLEGGEARIRTFAHGGSSTNAAFWVLITSAP